MAVSFDALFLVQFLLREECFLGCPTWPRWEYPGVLLLKDQPLLCSRIVFSNYWSSLSCIANLSSLLDHCTQHINTLYLPPHFSHFDISLYSKTSGMTCLYLSLQFFSIEVLHSGCLHSRLLLLRSPMTPLLLKLMVNSQSLSYF